MSLELLVRQHSGVQFSGQRPHGDLHAATQVQHQVERALLLDVVVRQSSHVFMLSSTEDRSLFSLIMVTTFMKSTFLPPSAIKIYFTRVLHQSCAWPLFLEQLDTGVSTRRINLNGLSPCSMSRSRVSPRYPVVIVTQTFVVVII